MPVVTDKQSLMKGGFQSPGGASSQPQPHWTCLVGLGPSGSVGNARPAPSLVDSLTYFLDDASLQGAGDLRFPENVW